MTDWTQVTLRVVHLLMGVFWAGTTFFVTFFLGPALRATGDAGDTVVQDLMLKRKLAKFVPISAVTTVVAGIVMYGRNISMSSGAWAHSRPGIVIGVGGVTALIGMILGATMIGPNFEKVANLQIAAKNAGIPLTADAIAEIGRRKKSIGFASRTSSIALFITVLAMAIARYM